MLLRPSILLLALIFVGVIGAQFEIDYEHDTFTMNGVPFRYVSGSLHYFRIPRHYWRDRLQKMKAAGLNAVSTYVEWSLHEPEPDQYDFTGDKNVMEFIKTAEEEGLYVILRVGPYICAERSMGGFPYWLLRENPDVQLRVNDPKFTKFVEKWLNYFLPIVKPQLFGNGGPIITVQVENEYGFYSTCDHDYNEWLAGVFKRHVQDKAVLFTTDGTEFPNLSCGKASGVYATVDFHPGANVTEMQLHQRAVEPRGPLINSEFYVGWVTHWSETWAHKDTDQIIPTLKDMLDVGGNLNFYIFSGGTNFGFKAGANGGPYKSVVTTYDFEAPITDSGDMTPKYFAIRDFLLKYLSINTTLPEQPLKGNYGVLNLKQVAKFMSKPLLDHLGRKFTSEYPTTFESISQDGGFVLYQAVSNVTGQKVKLETDVRDYAHVYVNEKLVGILMREYDEQSQSLIIPSIAKNDTIIIVVENLGRINNWSDNKDPKGLISNVTLDGTIMRNWQEIAYNFTDIDQIVADCASDDDGLCTEGHGFSVHTATFTANTTSNIKYEGETFPADTYLDLSALGKGLVFVNGFNLGRYWSTRGPVFSLYVPGSVLKLEPELNTVVLIEQVTDSATLTVPFSVNPIYGNPK